MAKRAIPEGVQVLPSILAADFARMADEIASVEQAGVAMLHLDVMDGDFVPEITFGQPLIRSIRPRTDLFLDTHLMIRQPLRALELFAESGADLLTLHVEALGEEPAATPSPDALGAVARAHAILAPAGCGLGLAFRPRTDPLPWLEAVGSEIDLAMLMTVEPGYGGQPFMEQQLPKITAARALSDERGWPLRIEVDGGITPATAGVSVAAGADLLVAGTAVFGPKDRAGAVAAILEAARLGRS